MRALLPYKVLYKHHKWMLMLGIVLTMMTLLVNIGLLMLSSWFLSAAAVAGVSGLYSFNYMLPAAGVRGAAIIRTVGRYFERLISHDATLRILQHLRVFIFSCLIPLSPTRLTCFRHGELLNRVVADVDILDQLYLRVILPLIGACAVIVVITFGLSILDVKLAFTLCSTMLLTLFLLPPLFYRAGKPIGESITCLRGEYCQQLTAWLQGQAELTIFGANSRYRAQMDSTELNWYEAQRRQSKLTALSQAVITLIGGTSVIIILWMASAGVGDNYQPRSLIVLFVFCTLAAFEVLSPVTSAFQHLGHVISSALRITQLIEQQPEVQFTRKHTQVPTFVELRMQNVTFAYDEQAQFSLNELTLNIAAGEHVVILGRTGYGKSTLLQLITRAWDPCQGLISINAIPITDFSEWALRCTVSIVTQRVYLFSATLRDNLLLAATNATDALLSDVLEQVGLEKLLHQGEGLNSWLGEGGRPLSGGELRRLAIARVLLRDAPLVLLDEPTEGLDIATEIQILGLLKQVMKNKTVLMVTHRLHGLANFNRIIVMNKGQIIEQGSHTELIAKEGGVYYQLTQHI